MGEHASGNEKLIAAEKDFSDNIGNIATVFDVGFYSQIIQAVDFRSKLSIDAVVRATGVLMDNIITMLDEFKGDITGGFHDVAVWRDLVLFGKKVAHQRHQCSFACAYGADEQDAFPEVDTQTWSIVRIFDAVDQ